MKRRKHEPARRSVLRRVISTYGIPLYLMVMAVTVLVYALRSEPVTPAQLVEVEGTLRQYNYVGDRSMYLSIVGRSELFLTYAIGSENGRAGLENGSHVRFQADQQARGSPGTESVRTFGLWIDGREVQSLQAALQRDESLRTTLVPRALVVFGVGVYVDRRNTRLLQTD